MRIRDKYNGSGCLDMTAFLAIQKLEREEQSWHMAASLKMNKKHKQGQNNSIRVYRKDDSMIVHDIK